MTLFCCVCTHVIPETEKLTAVTCGKICRDARRKQLRKEQKEIRMKRLLASGIFKKAVKAQVKALLAEKSAGYSVSGTVQQMQ